MQPQQGVVGAWCGPHGAPCTEMGGNVGEDGVARHGFGADEDVDAILAEIGPAEARGGAAPHEDVGHRGAWDTGGQGDVLPWSRGREAERERSRLAASLHARLAGAAEKRAPQKKKKK